MSGRSAAFRIYAAPAGTEALVWYGRFVSDEEAQHATKQWLENYKITSKDQTKDQGGQVIGVVVMASARDTKSGEKFLLIRRYGLNYWMIRSSSRAVAMQVDVLIEPLPRHAQ